MADVMRLAVGERVAAFGWVGCQYREGVVGLVIRFWVTGLGEWVYTIVLDVPEPDGVCLVPCCGCGGPPAAGRLAAGRAAMAEPTVAARPSCSAARAVAPRSRLRGCG